MRLKTCNIKALIVELPRIILRRVECAAIDLRQRRQRLRAQIKPADLVAAVKVGAEQHRLAVGRETRHADDAALHQRLPSQSAQIEFIELPILAWHFARGDQLFARRRGGELAEHLIGGSAPKHALQAPLVIEQRQLGNAVHNPARKDAAILQPARFPPALALGETFEIAILQHKKIAPHTQIGATHVLRNQHATIRAYIERLRAFEFDQRFRRISRIAPALQNLRLALIDAQSVHIAIARL